MRLTLARVFIALLGSAAGASGCSSDCESFCEAAADCEGDEELESCKKECEDDEKQAESDDCSKQFDGYLECLNEKGKCDDEDYDAPCDSQDDALSECIAEAEGL